MRTPLDRIRAGFVFLSFVVVVATLGYRAAGWSWIDAFYMVIITISTVGYSEVGQMTPVMRLFTMGVVIIGMSTAIFTIGGFVTLLAEGEIDRALGVRRMKQELDRLQGHIVVFGFGRIGQIIAEEHRAKKRPFVVIDSDMDAIREAQSLGYLALAGDATEEEILIEAGVDRAGCLVTALADDAYNVFITLSSRNRNADLQIIARGELPSSQKKLLQAGADRVVLPAAIGAQRIAAMITRPSTVELMELVIGRSKVDVEVNEFTIPAQSALAGKSVDEIEAGRLRGLLVVAVKRGDGEMIFNPGASFSFQGDDTVVVMGRTDDIRKFCADFGIDNG
jgi:voltage-gated potassium channel